MNVANKTFIITGSASGLGKAYASKLLENGGRVCISDVNEAIGKETLEEFRNKFGNDRVCFVPCDVTEKEQFASLFDETEKFFAVNCVDVLVNNAGINTNFGWRKCMDVNIIGVMTGMEMAIDRMSKSPAKGTIINCASMAGFVTGSGSIGAAYYASKHACVAVSRDTANEYPRNGIVIKCLCPAYAKTAIINVDYRNQEQFDKEIAEIGLMEPEEVAEAFYKLVTECGNGTVLAIAKGYPTMVIPDFGMTAILTLGLISTVVSKITGIEVVRPVHQLLCVAVFMAMMLLFAGWLI